MANDQQPDPQQFWHWAGEALRPVAGWLLAIGGVLALVLGYLGVSREALVAKQLPFLISGGLTGVALLFLGGALIGTQDVKRHGERIARLEELVGDLHRVLLTDDEPIDEPGADHAVNSNGPATVVVTPTGSTYHTHGCSVVASRADTEELALAQAASRGLHACKVCNPVPVAAGTRR